MTGAYYNERDPYAAQWLRNLAAAGHIPAGDVDERDIREVRADDLRGYSQHHFFAGIGVWTRALRLAGWPDDAPVWTGSCPCQPFSVAGRGGGTDDERHLWPEWFRLISECRPSVVFGEQVSSPDGRVWFDLVSADLEGVGYAVGAADLCAAGIGAPHLRQRLFFVADAAGVRTAGDGGNRACPPASAEATDGRDGRTLVGLHGSVSDGGSGCVADTRRARGERRQGEQRSAFLDAPERGEEAAHDQRGGAVGRVADAELSGRQPISHERGSDGARVGAAGEGLEPRQCSVQSGSLGDARGAGLEVGSQPEDERRPLRLQGSAFGAAEPVCGFWRGADWLYCRDGKHRPVRPGSFPLAHGAPVRVGRLRAYGNAIVPQVAAEFIAAYQEARAAA